MSIRAALRGLFSLFLVGAAASPATAYLYVDPKPPMSYQDLLRCEIVVVARYQSHTNKTLTLTIDEVWRGAGLAAGGNVTVDLVHHYRMLAGLAPSKRMPPTDTRGPRLCYLERESNPGDLIPHQIVPDLRAPNIYFLPTAAPCQMERRGQVQPIALATGWREAVAGRRPDVLFRLRQKADAIVARDALEELAVSRDRAAIEWLFADLREPLVLQLPILLKFAARPDSGRLLATIGDVDGDVYGPALQLLTSDETFNPYARAEAATILALTRPIAALVELRKQITVGKPEVRLAAVGGLAHIKTRESFVLAAAVLTDAELSEAAARSICDMLSGKPYLQGDSGEVAFLLRDSLPRLRLALADEQVGEPARRRLRDHFGHLVGDETGPSVQRSLAEADQRLHAPEWVMTWEQTLHERPGDVAALLQRAPPLAELLALVDAELRKTPPYYRLPAALEALFRLRAPMAPYCLKQAIDARARIEVEARCQLLSLAVRQGHRELLDELMATAAPMLGEGELHMTLTALDALRSCEDPRSMAAYIDFVTREDRLETDQAGRIRLEMGSGMAVDRLFPDYRPEFFICVLSLLRAKTIVERGAGLGLVKGHLYWDLGFEAEALQASRHEMLARVEHLFSTWRDLPEPEIHAAILREFGVVLPGEPSQAWLPALREKVGSFHAARSQNALWLIGQITGREGLVALDLVPAPFRLAALDRELAAAK